MRRILWMIVGLMMTTAAHAQLVAETAVTVSARVVGVFGCTLDGEALDFGDLDAGGVSAGSDKVAPAGRDAARDGQIYESLPGALNWTCKAAPSSTIDVALASTAADHVGAMATDDLEVRIPKTGSGVSTGFQPFATTDFSGKIGLDRGEGTYCRE